VDTVSPAIRVEIQNRDTTLSPGTIKLELNGKAVTPVVTSDANGAVVNYVMTPLPPPGATNIAKVSFKDNFAVDVTSEWSFVVTYRSLASANRRLGPGKERGFRVRMVQAPAGSALANDLQRAEDQLVPNSTIASVAATNVVAQVINQSQDERPSGYFPNESLVPGLDAEANGTDDFAVEITAWLELSAGVHRFGVVTDDGFKISSGASPSDKEPVLAHRNGGTADQTFDFVVTEPGFYPFRMLWYERGGNAYAEWFSVDLASGNRTLINDPNAPNAIKAYLDLAATTAAIQLESAAAVNGPYVVDSTAVINSDASNIRVRAAGAMRFYRLRYLGSATPAPTVRVTSIKLEGADAVFAYRIGGAQPASP
jgi:hypothetical protein